MLRQVCHEGAHWPDGTLPVAVNVATHQLQRADFAAIVDAALRDSGLSPHRLILEVTESALIDDTETVVSNMQAVGGAGGPLRGRRLRHGLREFRVSAPVADRQPEGG